MGLEQDKDEVKTGDRSGAIFFPIHKNAVRDFTFYSKKLKCI